MVLCYSTIKKQIQHFKAKHCDHWEPYQLKLVAETITRSFIINVQNSLIQTDTEAKKVYTLQDIFLRFCSDSVFW